jgi:hypothetical protein
MSNLAHTFEGDPPLAAAAAQRFTGPVEKLTPVYCSVAPQTPVSEAKRMLTLIDASEAGCADDSHRAMIVAQLDQGMTALPKATEPVVAIGKVDTSAQSMNATVTELVSGKKAWTHALSSSFSNSWSVPANDVGSLLICVKSAASRFSKVSSRSALYFARWMLIF